MNITMGTKVYEDDMFIFLWELNYELNISIHVLLSWKFWNRHGFTKQEKSMEYKYMFPLILTFLN